MYTIIAGKKERRGKRIQKTKFTVPLLILALLFTLVGMCSPETATASPAEIEWLTLWTEPEEIEYWNTITQAYLDETGDTVTMTNVEADELFTTMMVRHAADDDPDILSLHAMWLPSLANWMVDMLDIPPSDVVADITPLDPAPANYSSAAIDGSSYKGLVFGYPFEFNSHALVYNKRILNDVMGSPDPPTNWDELKTIAAACTTRDDTGVINQTGFMPYINGGEELHFEFMNLLWANGGEYLDILGGPQGTFPPWQPEALFNSTSGIEVLDLFHDLSDLVNPGSGTYDPEVLPDIYWSAWADETVAMVVIPGWFTYVRGAMGDPFYTNIGVAPIPIGPSGTTSASVVYNWLVSVTKKAANEGRGTAAWNFLKWLNKPRPAGYVSSETLGIIPRENNVSILGDFLIFDSIVPSRIGDQEYGRVWLEPTPGQPETSAGDLIKDDFWFKAFIDIGNDYGRAPEYFTQSVQVQDKVAYMFELVASTTADPTTTAHDAAADVNSILLAPGDIDMSEKVTILDAGFISYDAWSYPGHSKWSKGRADINGDLVVNVIDATGLSVNFGKPPW